MLSLHYDALSADRITLSPDPNPPTVPQFERCRWSATWDLTFTRLKEAPKG